MKSYVETIHEAPDFLVKAFEKKHLKEGESLRFLEEKQRRLAQFESRLTFWPLFGFVLLVMAIVSLFAVRAERVSFDGVFVVMPLFLSVCAIALPVFWFFYVPRLLIRYGLDQLSVIGILNRFRDAVNVVVFNGGCVSETEVKGLLVHLAYTVIQYEETVEKLRADRSVSIEQVVTAHSLLLQHRASLERLFSVLSNEFGFTLQKRDVFELALSQLDDVEETSP